MNWHPFPNPTDMTDEACEFAYKLEMMGDFYLTYDERVWIEERRKVFDEDV